MVSENMVSKKKIAKKILNGLTEKATLNNNPGRRIATRFKLTPKNRRHSGWVTPRIVRPTGMKYQEAHEEALEPLPEYDSWKEHRDGLRGYDDNTKKRNEHMCFAESFEVKKWNEKIKKLTARRKAKQYRERNIKKLL